ncbi:MAG TPA: 2-C-methyl-D-erythritol 2,4-cyclodiphosphate synthase [Dissulfurispiraceae bacterium]|nr:2-C-methyl-D-erythritol 2,4-cyclodiphosphate synthase [Dissulfurispiraceae bacterium]
MRIGIGYDSHRLIEGRQLILGGITIPFEKGLLGHSDGDALCHAITDALIGALGKGDIGRHFPDTDAKWKDASSLIMLKQIVDDTAKEGFEIAWIDTVVIAERPRLAGHFEAIKLAIAETGIPYDVINIKAKTNEKMGFEGRGEGISAHAVCLLMRRNS